MFQAHANSYVLHYLAKKGGFGSAGDVGEPLCAHRSLSPPRAHAGYSLHAYTNKSARMHRAQETRREGKRNIQGTVRLPAGNQLLHIGFHSY